MRNTENACSLADMANYNLSMFATERKQPVPIKEDTFTLYSHLIDNSQSELLNIIRGYKPFHVLLDSAGTPGKHTTEETIETFCQALLDIKNEIKKVEP